MNASKPALFTAGLFFGGAIDHILLAALGRDVTPYGLRTGVAGNWALAAVDLALAASLLWLHRRFGATREST